MFFIKKIYYNLTVYVTLYYTLANIDPYGNGPIDMANELAHLVECGHMERLSPYTCTR